MTWIPLMISLGAVLGALSRYYVTLFWIAQRGQRFPYGTLFVNLTGCLLMGFLSIVATKITLPIAMQKLILVGFLGSYTTFSSYALDAANLFRSRQILPGLLYWLGSPILGLICVEFGIWLAQNLG
ncbi:MAG: fluoride efflux transporter CrcB [Cyanobacteria bacterium P01_D01_bin.115]